MGRTRKNAAAAPETVQETRDGAEVSTDTPGAETASETVLEAQTRQEVVGPEDERELLGCQDEAESQGAAATLCTVLPGAGLNLRSGPGQEYDVLCVLPENGMVLVLEPVTGPDKAWVRVRTGQGYGYVMAKYLAPLSPPLDVTADYG